MHSHSLTCSWSPISNCAVSRLTRTDFGNHLSRRSYEDDALPRGWWKVSLITIALIIALVFLAIAIVRCCARCCGAPMPRFDKVFEVDRAGPDMSQPTPSPYSMPTVPAATQMPSAYASADQSGPHSSSSPFRPTGQRLGRESYAGKAAPPTYEHVKAAMRSRDA